MFIVIVIVIIIIDIDIDTVIDIDIESMCCCCRRAFSSSSCSWISCFIDYYYQVTSNLSFPLCLRLRRISVSALLVGAATVAAVSAATSSVDIVTVRISNASITFEHIIFLVNRKNTVLQDEATERMNESNGR